MTFKKSKEHALINKGSGTGYIVECDEGGNQICAIIMRLPRRSFRNKRPTKNFWIAAETLRALNERKLISKQGEPYL